MNLKLLILLLTSCFISNFLYAQTGTLRGKILEKGNTNNPIIGALIALEQNGKKVKSISSDIDGNYEFANIDTGTYDLKVTSVDLEVVKLKSILIESGKVVVQNIEMNAIVELVEVELSVIREPKALKDVYTKSGNGRGKGRKSGSWRNSYANNAPINRKKFAEKPNSTLKGTAADQSIVPESGSEEYGKFVENDFKKVKDEAFSTFSIDVDRASYSNLRRFIEQSQKPPVDAVRIEEMVNYFDYHYPQPTGEHPFLVETEVSDCPWNKEAKLVKIGLQGKNIDLTTAPATNLVFLIDVSGSMGDANKLPLLKESIKLLINNMRDQDKMALVVYAGAAGLVQASTNDKNKLITALDALNSGGSTAGGAGINLAYQVAKDNFISNGNNRVIIATDGDFNVGTSSNQDLEKLIVEKRKDNIFLTVLGFGMGNYKDSKMEILADKGNGNYAYIDNIKEAKKTLVNEMGGTLYVIAKDVKLQLEFDSTQVYSYRLVGYENRLLNKEDFDDDTKDAGEMGAGHTVTALYEIMLAKDEEPNANAPLLTLNLRYKEPTGNKSTLLIHPVTRTIIPWAEASENFRFAASVAGFGMLLRDSKHKNELSYQTVLDLAKAAKGGDNNGYRDEFIGMVKNVNSMSLQAGK